MRVLLCGMAEACLGKILISRYEIYFRLSVECRALSVCISYVAMIDY